uniref:HTH psq-type domain-containing protein n=1 Tax=Glossina austeni TaxID=7395 RepID=A0A1A9V4C8_GLOAU
MKFDISKTVLWRRVRKHPDYMKTARENPIVTKAYERLKSGESLKSISLDLDIPMSTLHRHKVRLSQQGQLPDFVTCKRRDSTSKDDLKLKLAKAVQACVQNGMSQNHAANVYGISKSTLWRHLQKRVAEAEASMEEDEIKEVILS